MWPKNINSYILGGNVPTRNEFNSDMTNITVMQIYRSLTRCSLYIRLSEEYVFLSSLLLIKYFFLCFTLFSVKKCNKINLRSIFFFNINLVALR